MFLCMVLWAALSGTGCGSGDGSRFAEQLDYYTLGSNSMMLTTYGASSPSDSYTSSFRCPSVSGLSRDANVSVMHVRANMHQPMFMLTSSQGIRSDTASSVGVSVGELPMGMLDIYKRCQSTSSEQYVTACPPSYTLVEQCDEESAENTCEKIWEGTHKLVVSASVLDMDVCYSEAVDRSLYSSAVPDIAYACDSFSEMTVPATYRGSSPVSGCCGEDAQGPTLDFCIKPCGCRNLTVQVVPKEETIQDLSEFRERGEETSGKVDSTLRFAVLSNVEGNQAVFRNMLEDIQKHDVAFVVSLGNLTSDGSDSAFRTMRRIVDEVLGTMDGAACEHTEDAQYCCSSSERQYPYFCNAWKSRIPFIAGLGEREGGGDGKNAYRELFGVSNMMMVIGKVQLMMIDTADASITSAARKWISSIFERREAETCQIPAPTSASSWPSLAKCQAHGSEITCHECIGLEASCIVPEASQSDASLGPQNCICVPETATYCKHGLWCSVADGTEAPCICTRDQDCGTGGTCMDGVCQPPMRFVFSYSPLFDEHGLRNNAFMSRENAVALLSQFAYAGTTAIFSGRVLDYSHFKMAGIDFYLTGGGGASMSSFASHGHHWLLVEIPDAYTAPEHYSVKVMDI